eukprot:364705-Chlamydomonas_euryale.AAC.4
MRLKTVLSKRRCRDSCDQAQVAAAIVSRRSWRLSHNDLDSECIPSKRPNNHAKLCIAITQSWASLTKTAHKIAECGARPEHAHERKQAEHCRKVLAPEV